MTELFKYLSEKLDFQIKNSKPLSGGDISMVYLLETSNGKFVLKTNSKDKFKMFQSEAVGLKQLNAGSSIVRIPEVYDPNIFQSKSYLLMEYIQPVDAQKESYKLLGKGLAEIHQNTQENYGANDSNFIGSLPQSNHLIESWSAFYWEERILPQLKLAVQNNYFNKENLPKKEKAIKIFNEFFVAHPPALLHGDLWNGNYFFDENGAPVLIDPSVYYGHPAMDIGMAKLFGGFDEKFFKAYESFNNLGENLLEQMELAQLYYLLVHLNLFGTSYLISVNQILNKYFT